MALHFTREEFDRRRQLVLAEMKSRNLDGLLMFQQESMYYLTGYDTFGFCFFQCLYLGADGQFALLTRMPDLRQAQNTSLVEDIMASGKTPTQLARTIEEQLSTYLREPIVTVTVNRFIGPYSEQIRVIGEAAQPRAVSYGQNMTLLDVMIAVGGLTQFADGNQSVLVRVENGEQKQYLLNIEDLIKDGDISANVDVLPGDIIVIPEAWF